MLSDDSLDYRNEYEELLAQLVNNENLPDSWVSDAEADSNLSYTTSNANIYLDARNEALRRLKGVIK